MRDCPYCNLSYATKQRLISHLTKTKKCYDVQTVGVPPILSELLGCESTTSRKTQKPKTQITATTETSGNRSLVTTPNSQTSDDLKPIAIILDPDSRQVSYQCPRCHNHYATQSNCNRHIMNNRCIITDDIMQPVPIPSRNINPPRSDQFPRILEPTSTSYREPLQSINDNLDDSCLYQPPKTTKTTTTKNKVDHVNKTSIPSLIQKKPELPPEIYMDNQSKNIQFIEKQDYFDTLIAKCGQKEAMILVKNFSHSKMKGDLGLLHKIYFDQKEVDEFPFIVSDLKKKKIYYKTPSGMVLDDGCEHITPIIIDNIQNCYLKFSNYIINANLDNNDNIFTEYDLLEIQTHIFELSGEKTKDKLMNNFLDLVRKNT